MNLPFTRSSFASLAAAVCACAHFTAEIRAQVPAFTTLVEFTGTSGSKPGERPYAGLLQASDGDFYGTTGYGGSANFGTVFKVNAAGTFTSLRTFTGAAQPTGGLYPVAGLAENTDGMLYGTTSGSFASGSYGIVYKVSASGSTFTNFVFFSGQGAANKGSTPLGAMVRASDGFFYGTTQYGGTGTVNFGTIYKIAPTNGALTTVIEFSNNGQNNKGAAPNAPLVDGGDGYLYGSTYAGGTGDYGTLFKLRVSNGSLTTLATFTNASSPTPGKNPIGAMVLASDGHLYGTTVNGGAFNAGVVYRVNRTTNAVTTVVEFSDNNGTAQGAHPAGALVQGNDGHLYGTTINGGPNDHGTIFRLTLGGVLTHRLIDFTGENGVAKGEGPYGGLIKATDGRLYGTTLFGGASDKGTVYRLTLLPPVVTGTATDIAATSATLHGTVNPLGQAATYQFEYGTSTSYGSVMPLVPGNTTEGNGLESVSAVLTGLTPATLYHYRLKITSAGGTTTGSDATFTTTAGAPVPPAVVTGSASNIGSDSATLNGTVNPNGAATVWQFEYGPTTSYGSVMPVTADTAGSGTSHVPVNTALTGLPPGATIHFRLKATSIAGTTLGNDATFTTSGTPQPPQVSTGVATDITGTSAVLNGTVNPRGSQTSWQFEYGPTQAFGSVIPLAPEVMTGLNTQNVSITLNGLTPGTRTYFRLRATNSSSPNPVVGNNSNFTTIFPPVAETRAAIGITTTGATLLGFVDGKGAPAEWQFQYGPTDSYGLVAPVPAGTTGTDSAEVSTTLTNLPPGSTWHYRLVVTTSAGTHQGADFTFTTVQPPSDVERWRLEHFGTMNNTGNAANTADPDNDGIINQLEYGFGMNPNLRDPHLLPVPTYNGSVLIVSFSEPDDVSDVTYGAEVSTDLINWSPVADSGSSGVHTFAGRTFMRLKVTLVP